MNLEKALFEFAQRNRMKNKGPLCVALVVTRQGKKTASRFNSGRI